MMPLKRWNVYLKNWFCNILQKLWIAITKPIIHNQSNRKNQETK